MFAPLLGVVFSLGLVLLLLGVTLRLLRRLMPGAIAGRPTLPTQVVHRLSLSPRQGIAFVRTGSRVVAVSVGEGGVRRLFELDEPDAAELLTATGVGSAAAAAGAGQGATSSARGIHGASRGTLATRIVAAIMGRRPAPRSTPRAAQPVKPAPRTPASPHAEPRGGSTPAAHATGAAGQAEFQEALARAMRGEPAGTLPSRKGRGGGTLVSGILLAVLCSMASPRALHAQTAPAPATAPTQATATPAAATPPATPATRDGTAPTPTSPVTTAADVVTRLAPQLDLRVGNQGAASDTGGLRLSGTVGVVVMLGLLTLLPTLVLMMTSFTRILLVLHFVKQGVGAQTGLPNQLIAALALILTFFVMGPTLGEVHRQAITPWMEGRIDQSQMLEIGAKPLRAFMLRQTRPSDIRAFVRMSGAKPPASLADVPLVTLMSAFATSELRIAFAIGFAVMLPFLVIDVVVSSTLMSMGFAMLPPAMVSLPFKLLLFVLVDGWSLVMQSLVASFR